MYVMIAGSPNVKAQVRPPRPRKTSDHGQTGMAQRRDLQRSSLGWVVISNLSSLLPQSGRRGKRQRR